MCVCLEGGVSGGGRYKRMGVESHGFDSGVSPVTSHSQKHACEIVLSLHTVPKSIM